MQDLKRRRGYRRNSPARSRKSSKDKSPRRNSKNVLPFLFSLQSRQEDDFSGESQELYLHRNQGSDEDRALLAIALHRQNIMPREQQQLLREIDVPIKERAFNPATFTSTTRAEAMRAFAFDTIAPPIWTRKRSKACAAACWR